MKNKKVIKQMSRFKIVVKETLLNNIPPIVLFDLYELNDDQINYLYQKVNGIYNTDSKKDEEFDSFHIPEKNRKLTGYNLNFLFQKLDSFKKSNFEQEYQNVREEIIIRNITLVKDCVRNLFKDIPFTEEDAIMFGVEGLLDAIDSYDIKSEISFSAHAIKHIVLNIQNHFVELTGITYKEYKQGINIPTIPISLIKLESPVIIEDGQMPTTFEDYDEVDAIEDEELGYYGVEVFNFDNKELRVILDKILKLLKPEQRTVIKQHFGFDNSEPMTYTQIGKMENVSITTISNRINDGLRHMIRPCSKQLPEFSISYNKKFEYLKNNLIKKQEEYSAKYIRICELLLHDISAEAFPNFMKMAGFELEPYNIEELVNDIEKICNIAKEENFNISYIYYRVENLSKFNKISRNVYEFICQNYNELRIGIRNFRSDIDGKSKQKAIGYSKSFGK